MGNSLERPCLKRLKLDNQPHQYTSLQDWRESANNHHTPSLSLSNDFSFLFIIPFKLLLEVQKEVEIRQNQMISDCKN